MRSLFLVLLLAAGCTTQQPVKYTDEPVHTQIQLECLMSAAFGLLLGTPSYTATQCECAEAAAAKETGLYTEQQLGDNAGTFKVALEKHLKECSQ